MEKEEQFRQEVRDFINRELPPELKRESHTAAYSIEHLEEEKEFRGKLGKTGWLRLGWPEEYNGTPATIMERYIFAWEMGSRGHPFSAAWANTLQVPLRCGECQGQAAGEVAIPVPTEEREGGMRCSNICCLMSRKASPPLP